MTTPATTRHLNFHRFLALAGMAGPVVLLLCDLTAGLTAPNYSYVKDSISSLALTELGWLQTIGFLAIGLLVEIFVAGLLFNVRPARGFHLGIGALVIVGFCLLLIGAFHTDPVGTSPHTTSGIIHTIVSSGVFWLFPVSLALMAAGIKKDPNWRCIFIYTVVAGVLDIVLAVALGIFGDESGWFGLIERLTVANMVIWVEVAAIIMLRLSLKLRHAPAVFGLILA